MGSPESKLMVQPMSVVYENFQDVSDNMDDRGGQPRTGIDQNIDSDEDSVFLDQPVAGSATVWAEQHISSKLDELNVGRMVFEEMRKMTYDEVNFHADNVSGHVEKIAEQVRRAWAEHIAKSA